MKLSFLILPILFFVSHFSFFISPSTATVMSNDSYEIELRQSSPYLLDSGDESHEQEKKLKTYTLFPDFNVNTILQRNVKGFFQIMLNDRFVSYGTLSATTPVIRKSLIDIEPGIAKGYSLMGFENMPLTDNLSNAFIPDTSCDEGSCSESKPSSWTNILTYGLGYRCESNLKNLCDAEFTPKDSYKQFADVSRRENPQIILKGIDKQEATIWHKLNIAPSQAKGTYTNTITFIALPNL